MKYIAIAAFAAVAQAGAVEKRTVNPDSAFASFTSAWPTDIQAIAATNAAAAQSAVQTAVLANAPWWASLPSDVQSFVIASGTAYAATHSFTPAVSSVASAASSVASAASSVASAASSVANSTITTSTSSGSKTGSSSTSKTSAAGASASSASSSGMAALPTGAIGAGIGAAAGFVAMLAL